MYRIALLKMDSYYCPLCDHCQRRKEQELQLIKLKLESEEEETRKALQLKAAKATAEAEKLKKQGVIYGENYNAYSVKDIRNITNYDFLEKLCDNIITPGQPPEEEDFEIMMLRYRTACERLNEVLINDME